MVGARAQDVVMVLSSDNLCMSQNLPLAKLGYLNLLIFLVLSFSSL